MTMPTPTAMDTHDDAGRPRTALDALTDCCWRLRFAEEALAPLQEQVTALRAEISELTAQLGRTTIPQFGTVEITAAARLVSYDRAGVEALVHTLLAEGQPELAQRINALRRETSRAGSLRITREKPAPTTTPDA